jgi:4-hydroxy-3-polyprenylbenzoate decarboxylase
MGYRNLQECVRDLESRGELVRIDAEVDPRLEVGLIQRRAYQARGPALLFTRVKGTPFPMLANLFGTLERTRYLFRDALSAIEALVRLKVSPQTLLREPALAVRVLPAAYHLLPRRVGNGPILSHQTTIQELPQLISWPGDGGAFITLPQVYTESPASPGYRHGNLGMYRVQLSGGRYTPGREVGLHYQIHRGIGVHHAEAIERGLPLRVNIFIGGPPALTVAAVMPLPEGMPELAFAGLLGGRRLDLVRDAGGLPMPAEADFCITGTIDPRRTLPEGPFGDHLGYYSLAHDFPVMTVDRVLHRPGAIWPFTTVGRPPQEDTTFGAFIHELTGPLIPEVIPGVHAVHAVDEAGVHPLLLAVGSERYVPYEERCRPRELLTVANAILGQGQLSLAKYLLIVAREDNPDLDIHDATAFFSHLLERIDWRTDLHFQTETTVDTLDYSGTALNRGSKVVMAATGPRRRILARELPSSLVLPDGFGPLALCIPGVAAIGAPAAGGTEAGDDKDLTRLLAHFQHQPGLDGLPLLVLVDDAEFTARTLANFLWVVFTRSDPAADIHGVGVTIRNKHWGCSGPLVIDARRKPHHAPPLLDDPETERLVDVLGAPGGPLHGII